MTLSTRRSAGIALHCTHCAQPVEHDDDIRRYVHTDTDEVGCDLDTITSGRAEPDLDQLVADTIAALDEHYTLLYLERSDDGLTPRQIQVLLGGGDEAESPEFSFLDEHESTLVAEAATQALRDLLDEELFALLDRADRVDELRWQVADRDDSGGLVSQLLGASPHHLFRYDLAVDVPDYTITSTDHDTRAVIAEPAGLDLTDPATAARVDELLAHAPYGGRLSVLWYGHPADAVELAAPHTPDSERGTVTFTGAHLLVLDAWTGSGHTVEAPVITAPWRPRRVSIDAARMGAGYSWTDTAGPVASAYAGTYRLDQPATPASRADHTVAATRADA